MKITTAFRKICNLRKRVKVVQGSQGAGKTYSVLQGWILKAGRGKKPQLCSIVTDTMPALRTGAIKDFKEICDNEDIPYKGTKTPHVYKIGKWTFEFYSVDKESKGRGGRRDRLFINEANRMSWKISQQLISRSHKEVILDFNPVEHFWAHKQFVETGEGDFVKLGREFHFFIIESTGNDVLREILNNIYTKLEIIRLFSYSFRRSEAIEEHMEIVRALQERDEELSSVSMQNHLKNAFRTITNIL